MSPRSPALDSARPAGPASYFSFLPPRSLTSSFRFDSRHRSALQRGEPAILPFPFALGACRLRIDAYRRCPRRVQCASQAAAQGSVTRIRWDSSELARRPQLCAHRPDRRRTRSRIV
ncbi:hypothetical protein BDY21DRAFT_335874 [Lineolata rhizophorae]|uniref:Uncharacterized protein n=1 Tax=Lineolata rhizophorae TaxID=578093 RepID=A0A6A6P9Q1_9PEZI|nr:hypothetical protein BDY21DRAFT_335874 [Lineolata rhizophorae]